MGQLRLLGEPAASDDHAALANLAFPQAGHTGFVAAAGLAGGQNIIGGAAPGEHLTLQSTAHAARGYVRAQDDLQLLSDIIRDSGGTTRLQLDTTSPHVTIPDGSEVYMADNVAIGSDPPDPNIQLSVRRDPPGAAGCALRADLQAGTGIGAGRRTAILGTANSGDTFALTAVQGLDFIAQTTELTGSLLDLTAVRLRWGGVFNTVAPTRGSGLMVDTPTLMGGTPPTTVHGLWVKDQGNAAITTLYGLKIDDQTLATNRYLIEAGPATPYLRLLGGANPAANQTNLFLAEGVTPTLRRVQWKLYSSLVAGDRVMVLV